MRGVTLLSAVADAAGKVSEDAWGMVGDEYFGAAWILDGATGLGDKDYIIGAYSDAAWYSHELSKALHQYSLLPASPENVFSQAIQQMAAGWHDHVKETDLPPYVLPSAAGIWIRWQDQQIEAVSLSDCRGWHIADDGQITQLGFLDEDPNDAWLAEQIAQHQKNGVSEADMRDTVMGLLRAARGSMNTDEGYQVFSIQSEIAQQLSPRKLKLWAGHILLCSDGLFRWSDVLRQGNGNDFTAACLQDLHATLNHVRELERADADCTRYTRLKRHDDATGIVLQVK